MKHLVKSKRFHVKQEETNCKHTKSAGKLSSINPIGRGVCPWDCDYCLMLQTISASRCMFHVKHCAPRKTPSRHTRSDVFLNMSKTQAAVGRTIL